MMFRSRNFNILWFRSNTIVLKYEFDLNYLDINKLSQTCDAEEYERVSIKIEWQLNFMTNTNTNLLFQSPGK